MTPNVTARCATLRLSHKRHSHFQLLPLTLKKMLQFLAGSFQVSLKCNESINSAIFQILSCTPFTIMDLLPVPDENIKPQWCCGAPLSTNPCGLVLEKTGWGWDGVPVSWTCLCFHTIHLYFNIAYFRSVFFSSRSHPGNSSCPN